MGVRILHTADLHLGADLSYLGTAAASRRLDLFRTFETICDLALRQQVHALLIAGDLFDSHNPPPAVVRAVQDGFERVTQAGIRVFVIPGDHDGFWNERSIWRKGAFAGVHLFTDARFTQPATFEAEGTPVSVHGMAYHEAICADPLATMSHDGQGLHLALLHATVEPSPRLPLERRYYPVSRQELANAGMRYVALGHLHRQQSFDVAGELVGCYPGSPEGLEQTESGPRFVALLRFDGGPPDVEFHRVNSREIRRVRLDVTDSDTEDVVAATEALADDSLLLTARLVGSPRTLLDIDEIRSRIATTFFWSELQDHTEVSASSFARSLAATSTPAGAFVRDLQERIRSHDGREARGTLEAALRIGLEALQRYPEATPAGARLALADLHQELDALRQAPGRSSPRRIEQQEAELLELEERYHEARERSNRIAGLQQRHRQLSGDLESLQRRLHEAQTQVYRVRQIVEAEEALAEKKAQYLEVQDRLDQFVKAHQRVELTRNERSEYAAVETTDLVTLLTLEHGVREAEQQLELARRQEAARTPLIYDVGTWALAIGGVCIGIFLGFTYQMSAFRLLLAGLVVCLVTPVLARQLGWWGGDEGDAPGIASVQEAESQLAQAKAKRAEVFRAIGVDTVEETVTLRKTYEFKDRNLEKALSALQALGDEKEAEEQFRSLKEQVTREQNQVDDLLDLDVTLRMMGSPAKRAEHHAELQRQCEQLESEIAQRGEAREQVERELLVEAAEEEDLPALSQRLLLLRSQLIALHEHAGALAGAVETLERCVERFDVPASEAFRRDA